MRSCLIMFQNSHTILENIRYIKIYNNLKKKLMHFEKERKKKIVRFFFQKRKLNLKYHITVHFISNITCF